MCEIGGSYSAQNGDTDTLYVGKSDSEKGIMGRLLQHKHERHIPPASKFRDKLVADASADQLADASDGFIFGGH